MKKEKIIYTIEGNARATLKKLISTIRINAFSPADIFHC